MVINKALQISRTLDVSLFIIMNYLSGEHSTMTGFVKGNVLSFNGLLLFKNNIPWVIENEC